MNKICRKKLCTFQFFSFRFVSFCFFVSSCSSTLCTDPRSSLVARTQHNVGYWMRSILSHSICSRVSSSTIAIHYVLCEMNEWAFCVHCHHTSYIIRNHIFFLLLLLCWLFKHSSLWRFVWWLIWLEQCLVGTLTRHFVALADGPFVWIGVISANVPTRQRAVIRANIAIGSRIRICI